MRNQEDGDGETGRSKSCNLLSKRSSSALDSSSPHLTKTAHPHPQLIPPPLPSSDLPQYRAKVNGRLRSSEFGIGEIHFGMLILEFLEHLSFVR